MSCSHPSRTTDRYTTPAIFSHWTILLLFLLVALAYLAIEVRGPRICCPTSSASRNRRSAYR